jgi:hypothetical protein
MLMKVTAMSRLQLGLDGDIDYAATQENKISQDA